MNFGWLLLGLVAAAPPGDAELTAIASELSRGVSGLRVEGAAEPYRAEARIVRADLVSIDGSYGGLITNVVDRQAVGTVEVRVGSLELDNTNFFGTDSGVAPISVSLEPARMYMRKKVWLGIDRAFRGATKALTQKQVALERLTGEERAADFTPAAPPIARYAEMPLSNVDRDGLAAMVASLSARYSDWPTIDNGDVHVQILRSQEAVVSTDRVTVQFVHERAVLAVVADTKAADGMHLDYGLALHFQKVPAADDELLNRGEALVDEVLRTLDEMAKAPLIEEEYDGPILLSGKASAQLLGATVATGASGTPAPLADGGRMMDLEPGWQKRLGKSVMPPAIDVVDDPTLPGFGHFEVDAEGFRGQRVEIVDGGVLSNFLMTRQPNAKASGSNGHARLTPALESGTAISNLTLQSRKRGLSPAAIERELLARAREDGYEFAFIIESFRDGSILGPVPRETASAYAGTGKVTLPLPALVYMLEPGGKRTLVRGAILAPASLRVLRRIRAVGRDPHTEPIRISVGAYGGWGVDIGIDGVLSQTVDAQITTPPLLVDGLELLAERGEHEKLPILRHPLRSGTPKPVQ